MDPTLKVEPPTHHRKPSLPTLAMAATAVAATTLVSACRGTVRQATGGVPAIDPPTAEGAQPTGSTVKPETPTPDTPLGGVIVTEPATPPPIAPPTAGVPPMDPNR